MTLFRKLIIAVIGSSALLLIAILPAEYGIDPTGMGEKLGLLAMSKQAVSKKEHSKKEKPTQISTYDGKTSFNIGEYDAKAERINESVQGLIHLENTPFDSQVIEINIEDIGEVEYKFIMPADTTFVYAWEVLNPRGDGVYYDFHGHPASKDATRFPNNFEMAYAKGEGTAQNGSFTSPFAGYHGFYFMNIEEGPITVRLTISGYWQSHQEMYRAIDGKVVRKVEF